MTRFQRFEDIEAWQKARQLANAVYDASEQAPFARDFGLRDQVRRAAVSVLSNIAEGFERGSPAEFIRFLTIAKGSVGELRAQLYIAADRAYVAPELSEYLRDEAARVSKMLGALIAHLRKASCR
ncbi:MAG: four helix bundle protein [Armatimonadetes bacterium]|nr:four helix bundle protein [Armatimonadota bacterium]